MAQGFRERVRSRVPLLGVFLKSPGHQLAELVSVAGLDFAVLDAEHAPLDLGAIDAMVLGARVGGTPCLVRPPDSAATFIGRTLDLGASGVIVPHVLNADGARQALAAAKFALGQRGFSPSTRAGGYGAKGGSAYRATADFESTVWCQIEDASALPELDDIASIAEIDCLFIGRADLASSLGVERLDDPLVVSAVQAIADAGRRWDRTVGVFISDPAEIPTFRAMGMSVFVCGSDQSYFVGEGRRIRAAFTKALGDGLSSARVVSAERPG